MPKSRNIMPPKRYWTPEEEAFLRQHYADRETAALAAELGIPIKPVLSKANALGLRKSRELIAEIARQRTMQPEHGGRKCLFRPGLIPWNKGLPGSTGTQDGCRKNQFSAGNRPHTWVPVGSYRVVTGGLLEVKVNDLPGRSSVRWHPVHRLVWEQAHGPVPDGSVVVFRPGMRTTDPELITVDKLICLTRDELMRRNSVHANLPPELARLAQLRGVLSRAINTKAKEAAPT
jgi:hypothetical protein